MTEPCFVLVAPTDLLPALKDRAGTDGEVLTFADADALRALQTIMQRRPQAVMLERTFAVTPRGAALINRIKADPTLRQSEIRVMAHNSDYLRIVPRVGPPAAPALDQRGTRRAARFKMTPNTQAVIDNKPGTLIDLSNVGAQVVVKVPLKPNQRIEMTLNDEVGQVHFNASVAWTAFETLATGTSRFRAGLNFEDADPVAVNAFCTRHRA